MSNFIFNDDGCTPKEIEISAVVRIRVPNPNDELISNIELQNILSDFIDTQKVDISNIDWEYPY